MPMSKGGKESENWPWKQSISPKTLTLCVTISAPMSVDFVSPYTLMRVATWPILKGRSIRLTWRGEWPGRPGMRLQPLRQIKKSKSYAQLKQVNRFTGSRSSRTKKQTKRASCSKYSTRKYSQTPSRSIGSCPPINKKYRLPTIISSTFCSRHSLMSLSPLRYPTWTSTPLKESSMKVGTCKGRSTSCVFPSRSDLVFYVSVINDFWYCF